jgi:hypothetical protein
VAVLQKDPHQLTGTKVTNKMMAKFTPVVNFITVFGAFFVRKCFLLPKRNWRKALLYEKRAQKTLAKLTPGRIRSEIFSTDWTTTNLFSMKKKLKKNYVLFLGI